MNIFVGKASFCDYSTIQAAVDALESDLLYDPYQASADGTSPASERRDTIYILEGVYEETVVIYRSNLRLCGLGQVEIKMNRYAKEKNEDGEEIGTFATATVFLGGRNLLLEHLTISNTAGQGEDIGQAVALYAHCDEAVIRSCTLRGHQDTLFTGPLPPKPKERATFGGSLIREHHEQYRQLYEDCYIEGTVDFIFGGATAYFEHCQIHSLRHHDNQPTYITAASTPQGQSYGYVLHECYLTGDPDITPVYLGRPWREYAQTVLVNCRLDEHIHPAGWDNWDNSNNEQTVVYQEINPLHADQLRQTRVSWAECLAEGQESWTKEHVFGENSFWK